MAGPWEDYASADSGPWQEYSQPTPPPEASSGGFVENVKKEIGGGLRQMFNPSEAQYPGSETLSQVPVLGNFVKNAIGSVLGGARALYAVPTAAGESFVGQPLKEQAAPYSEERLAQMKQFEPGLYQAISQMTPEEQKAGQERAAETAGNLAGLGLSLGGNALRQSPSFLMRLLGRSLDPLAAQGNTLAQKANNLLESRSNALKATGEELKQAQTAREALNPELTKAQAPVDELQRQMADLTAATTESKAAKLAQTERIPARPEAPSIPEIPGAAPASDVGTTFKQEVLPGAREALYGESSARYKALEAQGADIPLPKETIDQVQGVVDNLAGESRLPAVAGKIEGQLTPGAGVSGNPQAAKLLEEGKDAWRLVDPKALQMAIDKGLSGTALSKAIQEGFKAEGGATMANAMRADQILSAASRAYQRTGDLASRAAVESLRAPILDALNASPLAEGLTTAKSLHRETSQLVGARSLAERVFRTKPEQVVDNIFLPEARGNPNISLVTDAKQIYQKVAPGEWPKLTGEALAKLRNRVLDDTGNIDPGKFYREWGKYRETFKAALEPANFDAVDNVAQQVQQFNQSRRLYGQQLRQAQAESKSIREYYQRQAAQLSLQKAQLKPQIAKAQEGVDAVLEQIKAADAKVKEISHVQESLQNFGLHQHGGAQGELIHQAMSPHMMIALAQFGQAAQALMTMNMIGAGRQVMQGVVWATLGNPTWLQRIAQNPALGKALQRVIAIQHGARVTLDDARYVNAAIRFFGDSIQQETGGSAK